MAFPDNRVKYFHDGAVNKMAATRIAIIPWFGDTPPINGKKLALLVSGPKKPPIAANGATDTFHKWRPSSRTSTLSGGYQVIYEGH
jgi:hypothetical protein